jgi:hypothetical protein
MAKHLMKDLHQTLFGRFRKTSQRKSGRRRGRTLAMESLESRQMMSVTPLQEVTFSANAGLKPQSKLFEYADQWWTVMPTKTGTWVWRLDDTTWTQTFQISTNKKTYADVKLDGDVAHVLMFAGKKSQVATLQFDAEDNQFEAWSQQPNLVNISLKGQTGVIELDSTDRLWIAYNGKSGVETVYSDGLHTSWSEPITIAPKISKRDMSSIIAMPNDSIGIFWSDQKTKRFGFRVHEDGDAPTAWSADEVPGDQSAVSVGHGMADDHIHLAVTSDSTLYATVKTGYDKSGYPSIGLLVRRPNGVWDDFYNVSDTGTRGVIAISEAANQLIIAYTTKTGGGDIVYKTSSLDTISFSSASVLIPSKVNNVTTTKVTSSNQVVFLADSKSAIYTFDTLAMSALSSPLANDLALEAF